VSSTIGVVSVVGPLSKVSVIRMGPAGRLADRRPSLTIIDFPNGESTQSGAFSSGIRDQALRSSACSTCS
jgi:hypothetical protein